MLNNLRSLKNGKVKLQQLFTDIIVRSDKFTRKFAEHMYEKELIMFAQLLKKKLDVRENLKVEQWKMSQRIRRIKREEQTGPSVTLEELVNNVQGKSESDDEDD